MYRVQIQDFEGPLDLLLFFIRRDELDIHDIPISKIADEYLSYVRVLEQIDLDSVGDFIYMSAQLINIKARMLLPRPEIDDEGEPIDPRRELVNRLLNYMKYKEAAESLNTRYEKRGDYFTRNFPEQEKDEIVGRQGVELQVSVFSLITALQRVLSEVPETPPLYPVFRNQYSVETQREYVLEHLAMKERVSFANLIQGRPKHFVIITFLVLLEMAQQKQVLLMVNPDATDFYLERKIDYSDLPGGVTGVA
ncbi:MAG: segregation/condensation protein A [Bacteroidota bacterium]